MALRAARVGAPIVGVDRKDDELAQTMSERHGEGHTAIAIHGSVVGAAVCDHSLAEAVRCLAPWIWPTMSRVSWRVLI